MYPKTKNTENLKSVYLPVIHLNGTGKDTLMKDYHEAHKQLDKLVDALSKINFHLRDYYVIDSSNSFTDAYNTRSKIFSMLSEIESYLTDHLYHLSN